MKRGQPLRRTPIRRTRRKPPPPTVTPTPDMKADRAFWEAQRAALAMRAGYRCEKCGCDMNRSGMEAHHRKLRSRGGGHGLENLVALCPTCHRWCHAHSSEATLTGYIVPTVCHPETRAVQLHDGRTVLLDHFGGYEVVFP